MSCLSAAEAASHQSTRTHKIRYKPDPRANDVWIQNLHVQVDGIWNQVSSVGFILTSFTVDKLSHVMEFFISPVLYESFVKDLFC